MNLKKVEKECPCITKVQSKMSFHVVVMMESALLGFLRIHGNLRPLSLPVSLNWLFLVQTTECLKCLVTIWRQAKPYRIHAVSGQVPYLYQSKLAAAHPRQRKLV
jgi:hypothetical protein